ncbi:MAG: tRNA 4-thiouridine(8) synthase ThiI [Coriobacteriia bacterium]|nr:tRNA 4-thiouridine(8) synthase ThiI [Coriobacteriia bacterium]
MLRRAALIHYHEIGLKGRNRAAFERRLAANLAAALGGEADGRVRRIASRLLVPVARPGRALEVARRAAAIPGVSYTGAAYLVGRAADEMERAALEAIAEAAPGASSFAMDARRSSTDYPESSMDMNVRIGRAVQQATGLRVDLQQPDVTVHVEVVQGDAYVYAGKVSGVGGLPVGTSGKVVALISAGIDSPVAAWRLMKRGAVVVGVHFSGVPHTDDLSERFAREIGGALERYGGLGRLYFVAFGDLQREISLQAPPDLRVLLYRRLMIRVAEALAEREGALALVTGESLGQVASQTLENIAAVDASAARPVLRPLIGMDKLEIIGDARAIGTYELSIQPHADCCTLFMPRTPATRARVEDLDAAEDALDTGRMVADALASVRHEDYACPAYRPPRRRRPGRSGPEQAGPDVEEV